MEADAKLLVLQKRLEAAEAECEDLKHQLQMAQDGVRQLKARAQSLQLQLVHSLANYLEMENADDYRAVREYINLSEKWQHIGDMLFDYMLGAVREIVEPPQSVPPWQTLNAVENHLVRGLYAAERIGYIPVDFVSGALRKRIEEYERAHARWMEPGADIVWDLYHRDGVHHHGD